MCHPWLYNNDIILLIIVNNVCIIRAIALYMCKFDSTVDREIFVVKIFSSTTFSDEN